MPALQGTDLQARLRVCVGIYRGLVRHTAKNRSKDDGVMIDLDPYGRVIAMYLQWDASVMKLSHTEATFKEMRQQLVTFKREAVRRARRPPRPPPA